MPVSSKRRKKAKPIKDNKRKSPLSEYLDDFMDEVVSALPASQYCLVSILQEDPNSEDYLDKHYYVLSRTEDSRLVEHNEGPAFIRNFKDFLNQYKTSQKVVKVVVGYFTGDSVDIQDGGLNFGAPYLALQWKTEDNALVPDERDYNWNGYSVKPGNFVERKF